MIAKQVPMRSIRKSDFGDLVKYLADAQDKNERVGTISVTNCHSDNHLIAITEVLNTQAQNKRARSDKTYHLLVSFRTDEQPDDPTLKAIEARLCDGLGFGEHQRISVVHHDTDNLHFHLAINKIHPTRYTLYDPYNDHKTLGQLCATLERDYRLQVDNHQAERTGSENRADDMERHAGVQSLLGWIKRECAAQLTAAQSWAELHAVLHSNGLQLQERANGLVLADRTGLAVKASSVARDLSKAKLEQRLGKFDSPPPTPAGAVPIRSYEATPMHSRINTAELYATYKSDQKRATEMRALEWSGALRQKTVLLEVAKHTARLQRAAIGATRGTQQGKKALYGVANKAFKDEVQKITQDYRTKRQKIYDKYQRLAWADWLRAKATAGDAQALGALRAREAARGLTGNTVGAARDGRRLAYRLPAHDSITKKGTIIYRVGATAVRDDGDKLKVSRGATSDGLQAALRLAVARYGTRLAINGTADFKAQIVRAAIAANLPITFDDPALERRRQGLSQSSTTKEHANDTHATANQPRADGGRLDSRRTGGAGLAATRIDHPAGERLGQGVAAARAGGPPIKPNLGRIGQKPPPQSQNRLRGLSELGVVQLAGSSQVLLPRNVPRDVGHRGTQPDNGLRRNLPGPTRVVDKYVAADKYIAEREAKRLKMNDIPKHRRYTPGDTSALAFAGIRHTDGQALALLHRDEEIMVLPVDDATARRLKRVALGAAVVVTATGSVKTKGQSR